MQEPDSIIIFPVWPKFHENELRKKEGLIAMKDVEQLILFGRQTSFLSV